MKIAVFFEDGLDMVDGKQHPSVTKSISITSKDQSELAKVDSMNDLPGCLLDMVKFVSQNGGQVKEMLDGLLKPHVLEEVCESEYNLHGRILNMVKDVAGEVPMGAHVIGLSEGAMPKNAEEFVRGLKDHMTGIRERMKEHMECNAECDTCERSDEEKEAIHKKAMRSIQSDEVIERMVTGRSGDSGDNADADGKKLDKKLH